MRKTLLIAASAMAASIISSQAGVYSQNIVGYINVPLPSGYSTLANPFDESGSDSLTNLISNASGAWNYNYVYVWNGTGYTTYTIDNGVSTGVADPTDSFAVPAPTIAPGQALFFQNTASSNTLTIVGTVHVDAAATGSQVVGVTSNNISKTGTSPLSFIGSVLPVGGGLGSVAQFPATNGTLNYTYVNVPIITGGNLKGFTQYTVDNGYPSGFADPTDSFGVAEPQIPVAGGFFFQNTIGGTLYWTQAL